MAQRAPKSEFRKLWIGLLIATVLLIIVFVVLNPWNISNLASHPHPVKSYGEAIQRIEILRAQEGRDINPLCRLQLMTHDKKVDRAIILVHGYTNCPQQFKKLGQRFYDRGYNVLIAPLPHHGLADRLTETQGQLKAEELAAYADETVDIAQGLGGQVMMMGISGGGVTTAWAAQNRSDLDTAIVISPALGFKEIPTPLTAAVMNVFTLLPDSFVWWDPVLRDQTPPSYAYPRYSRHALVQILRLGFATQEDAQHTQPAAKRIVVVFNPTDDSINNQLVKDLVKKWQAHHADLTTYEFDPSLKLHHDLIDSSQPYEQTDTVYPQLIDLAN
jgi:carboxylesterase